MGWIGVDLDGTLAFHTTGKGVLHIGDPIPEMVNRVRGWLAKGQEVRIMTARVGSTGGYTLDLSGREYFDGPQFAEMQRKMIQQWCLEHIGQVLQVTASKDYAMIRLYDDRAVQVEINTGRLVGTDPCD